MTDMAHRENFSKIEFWYIWYEIFENGKRVKTGRYHRSYRHSQAARRKAYQLYGDIPHLRWTVSETCPWGEERRKTNGNSEEM